MNNLLYLDITSMIFTDNWTLLISRDKGSKIREKLKSRISTQTKIIALDFSMVSRIDKSFVDTFLKPLLREYRGNKVIIGVNIKRGIFEKTKYFKDMGLEDIDDLLRDSHEEFLMVDDDGSPYLFGVPNELLNKILRLLWLEKRLTFEQICFELDKDKEVINECMDYLLRRGFVIQRITRDFKYKYYEAEYLDKVRPYIGITLKDALKKKCDKIVESGHFQLPSGVHVDKLYHVSQLFEDPRLTKKIGIYFADLIGEDIDFVLTTETPNNIVLAHRIAQAIGQNTRSIFSKLSGYERKLSLHDGFEIQKGENGLIVVDVVVTGLTVNLLIDLLKGAGGSPKCICSIFDLSGGRTYFPPFVYRSIIQEEINIYIEDCPLCEKNSVLFKPKVMPGDWKW